MGPSHRKHSFVVCLVPLLLFVIVAGFNCCGNDVAFSKYGHDDLVCWLATLRRAPLLVLLLLLLQELFLLSPRARAATLKPSRG